MNLDYSLIMILGIAAPIVTLLAIIIVKMIRGREIPNSNYTPFDYITGHTPVEFHEEKEAKEERNGQGDDKD